MNKLGRAESQPSKKLGLYKVSGALHITCYNTEWMINRVVREIFNFF
jgi:hypothetical protein